MEEITVIIEPPTEIEVEVEGTISASEPVVPDLLTYYQLSKI